MREGEGEGGGLVFVSQVRGGTDVSGEKKTTEGGWAHRGLHIRRVHFL